MCPSGFVSASADTEIKAHTPTATLACRQVAFCFKMTKPDHELSCNASLSLPHLGHLFGAHRTTSYLSYHPTVLSREPGRWSLAMSLLIAYHGTLGEPLPSQGSVFPRAWHGDKKNETTSHFLIFLEKSSPMSGLRSSLLGTSSRWADSWGQFWPRSH